MKKIVSIENLSKPLQEKFTIKVCDSFTQKLKGLMGETHLDKYEGLLFVNIQESILNSSIHMLFMNFDICVIWISESMNVVDKAIAKKWHLYYAPQKPAKYFIEAHPDRLNDFAVNDLVKITCE